MTERARIVVVGSTMIDLIAYAERLPGDGETVVGSRFESGFGGKGANQAVVAARFGAAVTMVNTVGEDEYGTATIANFASEGIATDFITRVPGGSGVAPIWVDASGSNRIIVIPGANLAVPSDGAVAAVERVRPSVVIGQFEIPQAVTASAFRAARSVGAVTILNPAPAAPILSELLALTDWLVPNETEFALIAGEPPGDPAGERDRIAAFARRGGISIVVTLGERGAALAQRGGAVVHVPAPTVVPVDTTGAGDAFVGAFAVGLALGWTPVAAARLGCATAADSTTRSGTQRSYPDRERAATLLATATV